jgi:elongator complex protein 1
MICFYLSAEFPDKVEDAVKYIIFLSDVNELYKFALSIYDLSLVILIAQHSQKVGHMLFISDLNPKCD